MRLVSVYLQMLTVFVSVRPLWLRWLLSSFGSYWVSLLLLPGYWFPFKQRLCFSSFSSCCSSSPLHCPSSLFFNPSSPLWFGCHLASYVRRHRIGSVPYARPSGVFLLRHVGATLSIAATNSLYPEGGSWDSWLLRGLVVVQGTPEVFWTGKGCRRV